MSSDPDSFSRKSKSNDVILFCGKGRIFYFDVTTKAWVHQAEGEARIVTKGKTKTAVTFFPSNADTSSAPPSYCMDHTAFSAEIHQAVAVDFYQNSKRTVTFGKMASMSYTNDRGQAYRTAWIVKFCRPQDAYIFSNLLNYLSENKAISADEEKKLKKTQSDFEFILMHMETVSAEMQQQVANARDPLKNLQDAAAAPLPSISEDDSDSNTDVGDDLDEEYDDVALSQPLI